MENKLMKKLLLPLIAATILLLTIPAISAEPWHEDQTDDYGAIYLPPIIVIPYTPPNITLPVYPILPSFQIITEFNYYLWTDHGGWWVDAEKTSDNTDDDLMCWAASCSNALEWTGWGIVTDPNNGLLEDTDEMFQNFNYYWYDDGGFMSQGWDWWFEGTNYSSLQIKPSGNYLSPKSYITYYDEEWDKSIILPRIDEILHRGDAVTIGIRPNTGSGGHAITAWGYRYNSLKDKDTETDEYYIGIWVSDSDDNKGSNTADPPPNTLRYYNLTYNSVESRWEMSNYGGGWYIEAVMSLAPRPDESRPIAEAGANKIVFEGSPVSFSGSASTDDDSLKYRWDFDEDFLWDTTWSTSASATNTWPDNLDAPVLVSLEVFDGLMKDVDQLSVTVMNVAPTIASISDGSVDEGSLFTTPGSFTDPGADTWTATVDYGDGAAVEALALVAKTFTLSHTYKDDGDYTVTVTVTDDDGGSDTETFQVTVTNVAPTLSSLSMTDVDENESSTLTGSFSDPGVLDTFILTVNWGDGSASESFSYPAGTTSFSETHTYLDDNPTGTPSDTYTVLVTIEDDDGGSDSDSTSLTVTNVAPTADAGTDQTVDEGSYVDFSGSFTDPGTLDTHTVTWDFGDSTPSVSGTLTPTHAYGDNGIYTVTITVMDDDTGLDTDTMTVTVLNVAPTVTSLTSDQPNPQFILPGVHEIGFTALFTDPGWLDNHTAEWDYGDGTVVAGSLTEENAAPDATGTVVGSHVYDSPGNYTIMVTVTDDDGGSGTMTMVIKIVTVEEAVADTDAYIQSLDDDAFNKKAANQKNALANKFAAVQAKLAVNEYQGAINQLESIRSLMDGEGKDWITDPTAQYHLTMKIDDIIAYINTL